MRSDELAARLRATFVGELEEQVRAMNTGLLTLEGAPGDQGALQVLFRIAHTLKGASRAAGVPLVERVCHGLETLLTEARDGERVLGEREFTVLFGAADALADAAQRLGSGEELDDSPLSAVLPGLEDGGRLDSASPTPRGAVLPSRKTPAGDGQIRIAAVKLDAVLAAGADLLVTSGRPARRAAEIESLYDDAARCLARWRNERRRVLVALQRAGMSGAEPSLLSLGDEIQRLAHRASGVAAAARADVRALSRNVDEVLDHARRLRMRPFAEACEALPRAARDLAAGSAKQVKLDIVGGEVEADRVVLDGLRDALLQLVRNAIDHGIETPAARIAVGKSPQATVRVSGELRGDRLWVTVADDGRGLDPASIRDALVRRGIPLPANDRELGRALMEARISTRAEATTISGRGVGLDVVRDALQGLGGQVDVAWTEGRGTSFTLDVPVTLAISRVLLVGVAAHLVAVPVGFVERIRKVSLSDLPLTEGRRVLKTEEGPIPVVSLARLLPPLAERPATGETVLLVLLRAGSRRLAVAVDELLDTRDVALRPIRAGDSQLAALRGVALLESGRIALVVDPPTLLAMGLQAELGSGITLAQPERRETGRQVILVVDDSITTRTLERSILEAAGYEVVTAVDGADGWRQLQERQFDLVVADVEMPRMDGFTLCESIRSSRRRPDLPVVLVTALETPAHRARGLEVGADAYIAKSSFDQESLLETIRQLLN